jgi:hypothetical protein
LDGALAAGFKTYGVEVSNGAEVAQMHGHTVHRGLWDRSAFPGQRFDVVSLIHVMEHIHDPVPFLARVTEHLSPQGRVFICLPNYNSLMRRVRGDTWYGLGTDQHVWQYEAGSLARLVEKSGFKVESVFNRSMDHRDDQRPAWKQAVIAVCLGTAKLLHWQDELCLVARLP